MKRSPDKKSEVDMLRQKAEKILLSKKANHNSQSTDGEMLKLIHELQVHQVELELQNEELLAAKDIAEAATNKFEALYDFAPTGYYTLSRDGKIIELNLTGAKLLGKERLYIKNRQLGIYITIEDRPVFNKFLNNIFESKTKQSCEIALLTNEHGSTYIYLTGIFSEKDEYCLLTGVDITERKKAEEELQENNARLNLAMQTANMAWWEMDSTTGSVTFGDKKAEMLGYPPEKFKHYSDFTKLIHPDDHDKATNAMYAHIHGGKEKYEVEYRIQTKSGEYKWLYDIGSIVKRSTGGVPLKVTGLVLDISERKYAEEALKKNEVSFRFLFANNPLPMWVYDMETMRFLEVNETAVSRYGYSHDEFLQMRLTDIRPEEDISRLLEDIKRDRPVLQDSGQWRHRLKDGRIIDVEITSHTLVFANRKAALVLAKDITERKQAEIALQKSEERYRLVLQNSMDAILLTEPGGTIFSANPAACEMFQRTEEEICKIGRNGLADITDPRLTILLDERNRSGKANCEITMIRKDGSKFPVDISTSLFLDNNNEQKTSMIIRDITERRVAKIALQKSEETYRMLFENSGTSIVIINRDGKYLMVNEKSASQFGCVSNEIIGKSLFDFLPQQTAQKYLEFNNSLLDKGGHREYEDTFVLNGKQKAFFIIDQCLKDENGNNFAIQSSSIDITARKFAEEELRHTEERYRLVLQNSMDAILITEPGGIINSANPAACEMFQRTEEDIIKVGRNGLVDITDPRLYILLEERNRTGKANGEISMIRKDGTKFPVDISSSVFLNHKGEQKTSMIIRDISTRKKAEESLKKSNQLIRELIDNSPSLIYFIDPDGSFILANRKLESLFGVSPGGLIGKKRHQILPEAIADQHWKNDLQVFNSKLAISFEEDNNEADGKHYYITEKFPLLDSEGNVYALGGISTDITELKKAEESVKKSESRFKNMFELHNAIMLLIEPETGMILDANKAAIRFYGYSKSKLLSMSIDEINMLPNDQLKAEREKAATEERNYFIFPHRLANGDKRVVEVHSSPIELLDRQILYTIVHDITDRRLAEETIKRNETILKLFIEHSPAAIAMLDANMNYIVTSHRYLVDYELGEQNLIGRSHYEIFPEIPDRWKDIHKRCLSGITERSEEDPFLRNSGKLDWIRWEICPWYEADGIIGGIILFSEVITDSKIAAQSLQKSEEIWHKLVNTSPEFIAILDIEGNYQYLNHYAEGFSEKDISGKKAVDFIADNSKAEFHAKFKACMQTLETQHFEYDALSDNGTVSSYEGYLVPILEQEKVASVMSIANDITERKNAVEKISASEMRYRRLFESAKDGILILDAETGIIVDVNPFLIAMLNYSHDVFLGKKIWEIGSFNDAIKNKANFLELQLKEYIRYEDLPLETADGQTIHVEFISNVYYVNNQKVIQCNIRDISERKIAERQISKSREQLAQLYKHLNEVREEERTSIAREIHDDLGQSLAGLKIDLLGIKEDIHDKVCQTPKINKAISLVETTIKTVQKLSSQLRPQMLDELGLASAIEWQSNEFRKRTGVKCTLDLEEIDDIAENIAISLFRIFQASLTNIMLHSQAKSISVKLELKEDIVYLSVADNGIGITPEQLSSSKSYGIIGMRERANQINAKFEINTQPGKGTKITVSVSIK